MASNRYRKAPDKTPKHWHLCEPDDVELGDVLYVKFEGNDWYFGQVVNLDAVREDDGLGSQDGRIITADVAFSDGEFEKGLALSGPESHAFFRCDADYIASLPPLIKTVRSQAMLKAALFKRSYRVPTPKSEVKVQSPLLILPDVTCCTALDSEQVGSLGGSFVVLEAAFGDAFVPPLCLAFTETAAGNVESIFVSIATATSVEVSARNGSGFSFAPTALVGFKLEFTGQSSAQRKLALAQDSAKKIPALYIVPLSTIVRRLSLNSLLWDEN